VRVLWLLLTSVVSALPPGWVYRFHGLTTDLPR
jgi:hypothetical protein